jgi:hypothetical protein
MHSATGSLGELPYGAFKSEHQAKTLKQVHEFLRICAVLPLSQLAAIDPDESTAEAIGDWHYWVAQGYLF